VDATVPATLHNAEESPAWAGDARKVIMENAAAANAILRTMLLLAFCYMSATKCCGEGAKCEEARPDA
jgi:hypothetical protein